MPRLFTKDEIERMTQDEEKFWDEEFKFLEIPPEQLEEFLRTPIVNAIFSKIDLDDLTSVIEYTKDLSADELNDTLNSNGETVLSLACSQSNNPDVIKYLINKGCLLSHTNYYNMDCVAHLLNNRRLPNEDSLNFIMMSEWEKEGIQIQEIINNGKYNFNAVG